MSETDRMVGRLSGGLEAIEKRLARIEQKVDLLQSDLDQRKGISKILYFSSSVLGSIAGFISGYFHDFIK